MTTSHYGLWQKEGEFFGRNHAELVLPRVLAFLPQVLHPANRQKDEFVSLLTHMAYDVAAEGVVRQQITAMNRPDSLGTIEELHIPALDMCGQEDQITPTPLSREIARAIESAELVVVPECGHMVTLEQPEAARSAMQRWLKRVDAVCFWQLLSTGISAAEATLEVGYESVSAFYGFFENRWGHTSCVCSQPAALLRLCNRGASLAAINSTTSFREVA